MIRQFLRFFYFCFSICFSFICLFLLPAKLFALDEIYLNFLKNTRPKAIHFFVKYVLNNNWIQPENVLKNISRKRLNVILSNHISTLDFALLLKYLENYKNVYFVFKNEIKYIPGIGQYMFFDHNVIVQRNWSLDKFTFEKKLQALLDNTQDQDYRILVIFPEGTRISNEKLSNSNYGTRHLLRPKPMGITTIVNYLLRTQNMGTFYDVTMVRADEKQDMFMSDFFFSKKDIMSDIYITCHEIDISYFSNVNPNWIDKIWKEKDSRYSEFLLKN
jgi:1-acyl-sn-glycerol-3-phosphate acyltransferase